LAGPDRRQIPRSGVKLDRATALTEAARGAPKARDQGGGGLRDEIVVLDEFLPPDVYANLAGLVAGQSMAYGSRSNSQTDPHGHWSRKFVAAGRHNLADVAPFLDGNEALEAVNVAWKFLNLTRLKNSVLIRCYLNGYTYGTDGYFHTDSNRADEHTAILFMNESWDPDWAGETVFLDERGDIVRAVLPKRNRAVVFPAHTRHAGRGVSRKCTALRQTLIFKARKRRSGNFEKLSGFLTQRGAAAIAHKEGSLHDHLVRTFAILEARGFADRVCFGGGLHAIYGTNAFAHALMSPADRAAIASRFGAEAERLAYLFSVLDRPGALESAPEPKRDSVVVEQRDKRKVELALKTYEDLRAIECANLLDQKALAKHPNLARMWNRRTQPAEAGRGGA
jgi:SM-20-related protein